MASSEGQQSCNIFNLYNFKRRSVAPKDVKLFIDGREYNLALNSEEIVEIKKNPHLALQIIRKSESSFSQDHQTEDDPNFTFNRLRKHFSPALEDISVNDHEERILRTFNLKYKLKKPTGCTEEICLVMEDIDIFVKSKLFEIEHEGKGIFIRKSTLDDYILFLCERRSLPHGKSTGLSSKTRANACNAYVSFRFTQFCSFTIAIIRKNLNHRNHNVNSVEDKRVSRISSDLIDYIKYLSVTDLKPKEIVLAARKWAYDNNHEDTNNRRYFPSAGDIRGIISRQRKALTNYVSDSLLVKDFIQLNLNDDCIFFQSYNKDRNAPFIAIMMSRAEKETWKEYGKVVTIIDSSYSGITKDYQIYILCVRNSFGNAISVAYFILSKNFDHLVKFCLEKLKCALDGFSPQAFMTDKDLKLINALQEAFPASQIIFSFVQVIDTVRYWLLSRASGYAGVSFKEERDGIIDLFQHLASCEFEEEFSSYVKKAESVLPFEIWSYLNSNWINCGYFWSYFGRLHLMDEKENESLERTYLDIQNLYFKKAKLPLLSTVRLLSEKKLLSCNYCSLAANLDRIQFATQVQAENACINCEGKLLYDQPVPRKNIKLVSQNCFSSNKHVITEVIGKDTTEFPSDTLISKENLYLLESSEMFSGEYISVSTTELPSDIPDNVVIYVSAVNDFTPPSIKVEQSESSNVYRKRRRYGFINDDTVQYGTFPKNATEFKVFSFLRKQLGKKRPLVSIVTINELRRRIKGPENFTKKMLGRILRRGSQMWKNSICDILKTHNITIPKKTRIMSSYTYLTEDDCKGLSDDLAFLMNKYFNPRKMLHGFKDCTRHELVDARNILKTMKEDFLSSCEDFDLVTHSFGKHAFFAVIDFIIASLEHLLYIK